jgi:arsenite methyltransferase
MKDYLIHQVNTDDFDLVSVIDDLPLWSAPFGLHLLETIKLRKNLTVLDLGCGLGFPLLEIAQRLGNTGKIYGIDPWSQALKRVKLKIRVYTIKNVQVVRGQAEHMPFVDKCFDLIVSNNGLNNVGDMKQSLKECSRVCKTDAQLTFTVNLEDTMQEFYNLFQKVLQKNKQSEVLPRLKRHIYDKRKPLAEIKSWLEEAGFKIKNSVYDSFRLRYLDGTTMFNHYLIKYWFLDSWQEILDRKDRETIFEQLESELNRQAEKNGEIVLTIPLVTIDCRKK